MSVITLTDVIDLCALAVYVASNGLIKGQCGYDIGLAISTTFFHIMCIHVSLILLLYFIN